MDNLLINNKSNGPHILNDKNWSNSILAYLKV